MSPTDSSDKGKSRPADQQAFTRSLGALARRWKTLTAALPVRSSPGSSGEAGMSAEVLSGEMPPGETRSVAPVPVPERHVSVDLAPEVLKEDILSPVGNAEPVGKAEEDTAGSFVAVEPVLQEPALASQPQEPVWPVASVEGGADTPVVLPEVAFQAEPTVVDDFKWDLWEIVIEESDEYMPRIRDEFARLSSGDESMIGALYRSFHTMKGTMGQFGAMRARGLFHAMETLLEDFLSTPDMEALRPRLGDMESLIDASALLVEGLRTRENLPVPALPAAAMAWLPAALRQTVLEEQASRRASPQPRTEGTSAAADQTVRVRASAVDHLLNQASEMRLARSGLRNGLEEVLSLMRDLGENGQRLSHMLREIELHADSQIQSRRLEMEAGAEGFDPLEFDRFTRLQELARFMAEGLNDINQIQQALRRVAADQETRLTQQDRALEEIQSGLAQTRLTSAERLLEDRLAPVVRQTASELHREVEFSIGGDRVEVDRVLMEKLIVPLSHILRNALTHGIELPGVRQKAGKSRQGHIDLTFRLEGGRLHIRCKDDGQGLNVEVIRQRAVSRGLWQDGVAMSVSQAGDIICTPGFSTAESASELAGRGVGMDVVRNAVLELGGRFEIASEWGQGMEVNLLIPTSLSSVMSLVVSAADQRWCLPAESVGEVQVLRGAALDVAREKREWTDGSGAVWPFHPLAERLGLREGFETGRHSAFVVAIAERDQRVAVEVDRIRSVQELPLRPLGRAWARQPGLLGATLMPDGEVAFLLDLLRLPPIGIGEGGAVLAPVQPPAILVVDDSLTVRRHCERILHAHGYRPVLVKDGREALDYLVQGVDDIAAVVLDVEMPRMDGFELTRQIRADARLAHLPLIMVTSRTADKHRQHALGLGVNEYLGKPVRDEELSAALTRQLRPKVA